MYLNLFYAFAHMILYHLTAGLIVSDLALEAEFLASLSHPHIMKLRGVAFNGTSAFETGPTGYFLIIDRLFETLGDRIKTWAKSSAKNGKGGLSVLKRSISSVGSSSGKRSARDFFKTSSLPSSTTRDDKPTEDKQMDERLSVGEYLWLRDLTTYSSIHQLHQLNCSC